MWSPLLLGLRRRMDHGDEPPLSPLWVVVLLLLSSMALAYVIWSVFIRA